MKKFLLGMLLLVVIFGPSFVFAQNDCDPITGECNFYGSGGSGGVGDVACKGICGVLSDISDLLAQIVPVLVALGVVYFVYGVVMYVIADDEEAKSKGKNMIVSGVIGFAVILALWGLVAVLLNTFDSIPEGSVQKSSIRNLLPQ